MKKTPRYIDCLLGLYRHGVTRDLKPVTETQGRRKETPSVHLDLGPKQPTERGGSLADGSQEGTVKDICKRSRVEVAGPDRRNPHQGAGGPGILQGWRCSNAT